MMQINSIPQAEFKETKIGLIPVDWECFPIKDVVTFTNKPRGLNTSTFESIPFIPMELISEQDTYIAQFELRSPEEIKSGSYCERGDLLIAKITPSFENGKQGILDNIPTNFAYATTEVYALKPIPHLVDLMFLFGYFKLDMVRQEIAGKMEGTTGRQRVPKSVIENYLIPTPPLPEQRRIAAVLNTIQDEIAVQDDILRELREFKRSTMERLFTYGAGDTHAETKLTEIGEIPVHWEVLELEEVADIDYGIQAAVAHMTDESIGIPILTNVNIDLEGYLDLSLLRYYPLPNKKSDKILKHGDVLFNWRSGSEKHVGKTAIFDLDDEYTFSSFILRFRIKKSVQTHFLVYFLQYQKDMGFFTKKSGQSSVNSVINASNAAKLPVAFSEDTKEQDRIVSILSDIDAKIGAEEDRKSALQDFFRTMLQQLMTGQIRLLSDDGLENI